VVKIAALVESAALTVVFTGEAATSCRSTSAIPLASVVTVLEVAVVLTVANTAWEFSLFGPDAAVEHAVTSQENTTSLPGTGLPFASITRTDTATVVVAIAPVMFRNGRMAETMVEAVTSGTGVVRNVVVVTDPMIESPADVGVAVGSFRTPL
jgi:hypothetical protein